MDPLIQKLHQYRADHRLSRKELATQLGIPYPTVKSWLGTEPENKISAGHAQRIQALLAGASPSREAVPSSTTTGAPETEPVTEDTRNQRREAKRRVGKLKMLLLLLEDELQWFRDGEDSRRKAYRETLDPYDIGYISSLLSMLTDEEKFQRWKLLTTNRFKSLARRPKTID